MTGGSPISGNHHVCFRYPMDLWLFTNKTWGISAINMVTQVILEENVSLSTEQTIVYCGWDYTDNCDKLGSRMISMELWPSFISGLGATFKFKNNGFPVLTFCHVLPFKPSLGIHDWEVYHGKILRKKNINMSIGCIHITIQAMLGHHIWLVLSTPLKNMSPSVGMILPNICGFP